MNKTVCELFAGVGGFRCGLNNIKSIEDKKEEKIEKVDVNKTEKKTDAKADISKNNNQIVNSQTKQENKVQTNTNQGTTAKKEEVKDQTVKQEETKTEQAKKEEPKVQEPVVEQPKVEETKPQEMVKEFKINNTYIQKMKNYIKNNETEDMKEYGYTIVVDSSIVNQTTGFTYSDFNMNSRMGFVGEIRIYAQDYFVNGEYVETRCYVY